MEKLAVVFVLITLIVACILLFCVIVKKANEKNGARNGLLYTISEMKKELLHLKSIYKSNAIIIESLDEFLSILNGINVPADINMMDMIRLAYRVSLQNNYRNSLSITLAECWREKDSVAVGSVVDNMHRLNSMRYTILNAPSLLSWKSSKQSDILLYAESLDARIARWKTSEDSLDSLYIESKLCIAKLENFEVFNF